LDRLTFFLETKTVGIRWGILRHSGPASTNAIRIGNAGRSRLWAGGVDVRSAFRMRACSAHLSVETLVLSYWAV